MADDIDLANDLINNEISRALSKLRQVNPAGRGAKHCQECGDDMLEGRRALGFSTCVPCAGEVERRKSLYAD